MFENNNQNNNTNYSLDNQPPVLEDIKPLKEAENNNDENTIGNLLTNETATNESNFISLNDNTTNTTDDETSNETNETNTTNEVNETNSTNTTNQISELTPQSE